MNGYIFNKGGARWVRAFSAPSRSAPPPLLCSLSLPCSARTPLVPCSLPNLSLSPSRQLESSTAGHSVSQPGNPVSLFRERKGTFQISVKIINYLA